MNKEKIILSIQSALRPNMVALVKTNGDLIEEVEIKAEKRTTEKLKEVTEKLLKNHGFKIKDVEAIGVCIGPGSFTGLRGGIGFAKAICQFSEIKLIGVTAFEALKQNEQLLPIIDARGERVYVQSKDGYEVKKVVEVKSDLGSEVKLVGSGVVAYKDLLSEYDLSKENELTACKVAKIAIDKLKKDQIEDPYELTPLYISSPNITKPNEKKVDSKKEDN